MQCVYVQIIKEMLRLVSMNFASFREAKRDVTINGLSLFHTNIYTPTYYCHCWSLKKNRTFIYFIFSGYIIPKGWKVLPWLRAIHMDPTYYPNSDEFNPSRWDVSCINYYSQKSFLFFF